MGAEIDRVELQVEAQASKANQQIDVLIGKLTKLCSTLTGVNMSGLSSMAVGVRNISAAMKTMNGVKTTDFNKTAKGVEKLAQISTGNMAKSADTIIKFADSMTALSSVSTSNIDTKKIKSVINSVSGLMSVDAGKAQQLSGSIQQVTGAIGTLGSVNAKNTGINNTINSLKRLVSIDLSNFNAGSFDQIARTIFGIATLPDVSNNLNRFISSLARLSGAGSATFLTAQAIPVLSANLKDMIKTMLRVGDVSESTNMFVQSIGRLASAGSKTAQTAAGLKTLSDEALKFFQAMTTAPIISENTLRMAEALAQLAAAGGKVGTAGDTVQNVFNKMSMAGSNAVKSMKNVASSIISSFMRIGNSSGHINKATLSIGRLIRSIAPLLGIRQLFNWGKQSVEIASDLTEVQNVVDATFGDFKSKIEDFSNVSISDFGMSELTAKQIASRYQAMGVAMGFSQGKMADMSVELTKLAADMASFYNVEQSDVAESLNSIFTGQTRPLRQYGLDLTQATLQEWAMKQGLDANISSMSQAEKTMLRYQYVMANTSVVQGDFARTSGTWANQTRILAQNFQVLGSTIGNVLINAFKPLVSWLNTVMAKVISVVKTIADALGAIFGWTLEITPAGAATDYDDISDGISGVGNAADGTGGSLGNAAEQAEDLKRALMGFDEIEKLPEITDTSGSGGGGSGGSGGAGSSGADGGASAQLVRTESLFEKYKSEIDSLEELGEYIGDTLTRAMRNIDWDKIYSAAENFGIGLASFLNGLISPGLFYETGRLVANCLNTSLHFLDSFGHEFDFDNFGESIAAGIKGQLGNIDFKLADDTFKTWGNGIAKSLNKVMTPDTFSAVGKTIAKSVNTVVSGAHAFIGTINWDEWGTAIGTGINDFFSTLDWYGAGVTFKNGAEGILSAIKKGITTIHWDEVAENISDFIKGADFKKLLSDVGELIWEAIKAAITVWKGCFDENPIETTIVTAVLGIKFTGIGGLFGYKFWKKMHEALFGSSIADAFSSTMAVSLGGFILKFCKAAIPVAIGLGAFSLLAYEVMQAFKDAMNSEYNDSVSEYIKNNPGSMAPDGETPEIEVNELEINPKRVTVSPQGEIGVETNTFFTKAKNTTLDCETMPEVEANTKLNYPKIIPNLELLADVQIVSTKGADASRQEKIQVIADVTGVDYSNTPTSDKTINDAYAEIVNAYLKTGYLPSVDLKGNIVSSVDNRSVGQKYLSSVANITKTKDNVPKSKKQVSGMTAEVTKTKSKSGLTLNDLLAYAKSVGWDDNPDKMLLIKAVAEKVGWNNNANKNITVSAFTNALKWATGANKNITPNAYIELLRWATGANKTVNANAQTSSVSWASGANKNVTVSALTKVVGWLSSGANKNVTVSALTKAVGWASGADKSKIVNAYTKSINWASNASHTLSSIYGYVKEVTKQPGITLILSGIVASIAGIFGGKADGGVYINSSWRPITAYASGGAPTMGQMFIAREAGPELVGRIGGHTAVMNNDQIVASVSSGVYQAVAAAINQAASRQGSGGNQQINVYVGGKQVTDVVIEQVNNRTKTTGVCPILT